MIDCKIRTAQDELSVILTDHLSPQLALGLVEAVAEAYEVPVERLSLTEALRQRAQARRLKAFRAVRR